MSRCLWLPEGRENHAIWRRAWWREIIASQIAAIFNAESRPHAEERLRVFIEIWRDKLSTIPPPRQAPRLVAADADERTGRVGALRHKRPVFFSIHATIPP